MSSAGSMRGKRPLDESAYKKKARTQTIEERAKEIAGTSIQLTAVLGTGEIKNIVANCAIIGETSSGKSSTVEAICGSSLTPSSEDPCTGYVVEITFSGDVTTYRLTHELLDGYADANGCDFSTLETPHANEIMQRLLHNFHRILCDKDGKFTRDPEHRIVGKLVVPDGMACPLLIADTYGPRGLASGEVLKDLYLRYSNLIITISAQSPDMAGGTAYTTLVRMMQDLRGKVKVIPVLTRLDMVDRKARSEIIEKFMSQMKQHLSGCLDGLALVQKSATREEIESQIDKELPSGLIVGSNELREKLFGNYAKEVKTHAARVYEDLNQKKRDAEEHLSKITTGEQLTTVALDTSNELVLDNEYLPVCEKGFVSKLVGLAEGMVKKRLVRLKLPPLQIDSKTGNSTIVMVSHYQAKADKLMVAVGNELANRAADLTASLTAEIDSLMRGLGIENRKIQALVADLWQQQKIGLTTKLSEELLKTPHRIRITGIYVPVFHLEGEYFASVFPKRDIFQQLGIESSDKKDLQDPLFYVKDRLEKLLKTVFSQMRDIAMTELSYACEVFRTRVHADIVNLKTPLYDATEEEVAQAKLQVERYSKATVLAKQILDLVNSCQ